MPDQRPSISRRRHRLTRLGFHFLFVGAFAMLGGALRGFNLLLVLAGLLVGALIMQWRWSRHNVMSTMVQRRLASEAFAGMPFRIRYRLTNFSRFVPVWMIRVEDPIESSDSRESALAVCGAGVISAGRTVVSHCDCVITRRGRYRFGPVTVMTSFPFSLFTSRSQIDHPAEMHVFPQLLTLRHRWQHRLTSRSGGVATTARRSGPVEGDFFGLREWQTGDSPKWIHWRTTARLSELAVRQFEQQRRFDACILVDAFDHGQDDFADVELAISLAATFVVHLAGSPSNRIVLACAAAQTSAVIGGGSSMGKRRMLKMLAEIEPTSEPDLRLAVRKATEVVGHTQDMIVISPRALDAVRLADPETQETITPWARSGSFRWIDVSGPQIDQWIVRNVGSDEKATRDDLAKAIAPDRSEVS